jgi:hypothetical protein
MTTCRLFNIYSDFVFWYSKFVVWFLLLILGNSWSWLFQIFLLHYFPVLACKYIYATPFIYFQKLRFIVLVLSFCVLPFDLFIHLAFHLESFYWMKRVVYFFSSLFLFLEFVFDSLLEFPVLCFHLQNNVTFTYFSLLLRKY